MTRSATTQDAARLMDLWRSAGLRFHPDLVADELASAQARGLVPPGISCNVIAGLAHDHLFVDWDQGARALALLRAL